MKPSEETRRLKFIQAAAARVLAARGEPFYRSLLLPGGPDGSGQWGVDTIALWVLSGMLIVVDDSNPAKRVFKADRMDIWQSIVDDPVVAGWYVTQRITSVKKNGSPDLPPQFQQELPSHVRLLEEESEEELEEPELATADPMMTYIERTVSVLENIDSRQRELLREIKDQSDLVLGAVSRLEGVASRDDVAGAAAELIGVVVKASKQNDLLEIRMESISSGVSALHTNVSAMHKNMETVLAHLGRTFADRLDAQREAADKRMAQFEAKVEAAMQRIESSHLPDIKPFEELMDRLIDNIDIFTKLKSKTNEAQDRYNEHLNDGVDMAKKLVALAFGLVKSAGASPDEIAEAINSAASLKTLSIVGAAMQTKDTLAALVKADPPEKHNRRVRRALASVERK